MDDLSAFACANPNCPDQGRRGAGNMAVRMRYGKAQPVRLLICRTCHTRFSERQGTLFFRSRLSPARSLELLSLLVEGHSLREAAVRSGLSRDTVARFARRAGLERPARRSAVCQTAGLAC